MSSVAGGMADFEDIHEEGMGSDLDEGLELSIESRYPEKEMRDNEPLSTDSNSEEQWRWIYDYDHRTEPDNAVGITTDDTWHGGIRLDLSGDIGSIITEVAYYDWGENATSVQAHVAEESGGAPGSWIASSEEYVPEGAGWVELELDEPVEIETPGEYWIVLEIEDMGGGHFPFGCISP